MLISHLMAIRSRRLLFCALLVLCSTAGSFGSLTAGSANPARALMVGAARTCSAHDLRASSSKFEQVSNSSAGGYIELVSKDACSLKGFPRLQLKVGTRAVSTKNEKRNSTDIRTVTLKAGHPAYFGFSYTTSQSGGRCPGTPHFSGLKVTPPHSRQSVAISARPAPCGKHHTLYVGPIRASRAAAKRDEA
jgi:hypothetical protein